MVENLREKALKAYEALFNDQDFVVIDGARYTLDYTSLQGLRKFQIDGLGFIEQNPDKGSSWAEKAREGHNILWVMKGRRYIAQVFDGEFRDLREK